MWLILNVFCQPALISLIKPGKFLSSQFSANPMLAICQYTTIYGTLYSLSSCHGLRSASYRDESVSQTIPHTGIPILKVLNVVINKQSNRLGVSKIKKNINEIIFGCFFKYDL